MVLVWGSAFAYEFGDSAPFYEFTRDKESELQNCLNEAVEAMKSSTVNVKITLRNPSPAIWKLSEKTVGLIRTLANGSGKGANLWLEANPDYMSGEQSFKGSMGTSFTIHNAFRSFDLVGGPIVITTTDAPLTFGVTIASEETLSFLYGLTFDGCSNKSSGGAVVSMNDCVRIVNCTFNQCSSSKGQGGAIAFFGDEMKLMSDGLQGRFCNYSGSELLDADYQAAVGSHVCHCTFNSCSSAEADGGAICGVRRETGTVITDCTFSDCRCPSTSSGYGRGGAIYGARTAYRCTFNQCSAGKYGGGCYNVYYTISSLFRECTSGDKGGAADRADGTYIRILNCTFDNCKSKAGNAIVGYSNGKCPVCACLFHGSTYANVVVVLSINVTDQSVDDVFLARPGDYHIRPGQLGFVQTERIPKVATAGKDLDFDVDWKNVTMFAPPTDYSQFFDRDGMKLVAEKTNVVAGCYRYYDKDQWAAEQERRKPNEWKVMNPLVVTVADDIDENPKDCKISFREACKYLEQHITAPVLVSEDQWPRITFSLPAGGRTVNLFNAVGLSDERRVQVADDNFRPVIIDGGGQGLTIRNSGAAARLLDLRVAGVVSNVLFSAGAVSVGSNKVTFADRNVYFENCAFQGGTNADCLVESSVGNVNFNGCSFVVPKDGKSTGAAQLTMSSVCTSRFDCCTFTGFLGINGAASVINAMDKGGELRLSNCTFAGNDGVDADVKIGSKNKVVRFYALNCIFGDGFGKAYTLYPAVDDRTVFCPLWPSPRYDPANKGELMVNIAGAREDLLDSDCFTSAIRGVLQYGFKPKHAATARYGQGSYTFADHTTMAQPALDIFRQPQSGLYHSMGSFYIDDREAPSIAVSTSEDVTDPYDDVISLREAVAYGGADERFASQSAITPTFDPALEETGVVTLSVTGAIQVAAAADGGRTAYQNLALRIAPGGGQRLVIRSATNSYDGVFSQKAGTKLLQFDRVRFDRCGSIRGDGGVLDTEGRYRFDDCAFDACWSTGVGGLPGGELVANINRAIQDVHDAGFTDDFGLASVCQITNRMNDVAEKLLQVADIMRQAEPDMVRVKALADAVWGELSSAVDSACETLSGILVKLQDAEFDVWGDSGKLAKLREAQKLVTACKGTLQTFLTDGGFGLGGAIRARAGSDGIVLDASASRCYAMSAGGVVASEGRLVGANLTFCRNTAASGAAVACRSGTNLFASVAFVDNASATNGALHASGGFCGIVNSLLVANKTASGAVCNMTAADGATTNVQYTIDGADIAKTEVFANGGEPIIAVASNRVEHLYYPLDPMGLASGTGAYVFFKAEKGGQDCRQAGWLNEVLYTTDPDGFNPRAQPLVGTKTGFNSYLLYDLLGNLIESWDKKLQRALPASMGPVPKMAAAGPSAVVTTTRDDVGAAAGETTLRAAAEYAMTNGLPVVIADELFTGGKAVFELNRQIDVPKGAVLRIDAGTGRTVELRPAEAKETNRFFNVFGSLSAVGLTLRGGYARSDYGEMSLRPVNDADGGAVIGYGPMAFTNCNFLSNRASGHGGAIWSCGGLSIAGCTFVTNCADCYGGAVYSNRERLDVSGSTFTDNIAQRGGAIYVFGSTNAIPQIQSTDIERNVAKVSGGGLYLEGGAEDRILEIRGVDMRIVGNVAGDPSSDVFTGEWVKFTDSESPEPQPEPHVDDFEGGSVTYPKTPKSKGAYQEFLKEKSTAAWTAKADAGFVFGHWEWTNGTECAAFVALSENERRNKSLRIRIAEGEKVRPADVAAVWHRIDEDLIESVGIDTNGLHVATKSYVTATVVGLPSGLKFNAKSLAITGSVKARDRDYAVKVSVKNASGYTWKQTFTFTVSGGLVTGITEGAPVTTGAALTLWGDAELGAVKGAKVYVAGKKATIRATPAKGAIFLGWYADPGFANAATNLPKGYLTASQSVVVPEGGLALYARFAELKPWAVGTFDGVCYDGDTNEFGTVTLTVSSTGRVSGKAMVGGKTYSFSAPMLDDAREANGETVFVAHPVVKVNGAQRTMSVVIGEGRVDGLGCAEIGGVEGCFALAAAVQNGWKLKPAPLPAFPTGRSALSFDTQDGLVLKFGAKGVTKVSGKVDGTNVSASAQVLPVAWIGDGKEKLVAQVCAYVARKDFCKVYDVVFAVEDGKVWGIAK